MSPPFFEIGMTKSTVVIWLKLHPLLSHIMYRTASLSFSEKKKPSTVGINAGLYTFAEDSKALADVVPGRAGPSLVELLVDSGPVDAEAPRNVHRPVTSLYRVNGSSTSMYVLPCLIHVAVNGH